jgi:ribosomal protein L7/L12
MTFLLISCGAIVLALIVFMGASSGTLMNARNRGIYPKEGEESDADVIRLLKAGEKILAIRCYREIHKVGLRDAKEAVERIDL